MKKKNDSRYPFFVLMILCIGFFLPNYAQYQMAPLASILIETFNLNSAQYSSLFSASMVPAIFLSLISGLLVDRFGSRQVIGIALTCTALGTCMRIWSYDYQTLFFSLLFIGMSGCFLSANGAKILGTVFSADKVGKMVGVFLASSSFGMTLGTGTTAMFSSLKTAYGVAAMIAVTAAVAWWIVIREIDCGEQSIDVSIKTSLSVVIKNRMTWTVGFCLMFLFGCNILISSFLPSALGSRGINSVAAGYYAATVTVGQLFGCILIPGIIARVRSVKVGAGILAFVASFGVSFGWRMPYGVILIAVLLITGFSIGGLISIFISIPIRLPEIGPAYAGTAGGFVGTLQLIGAVVIPTYIASPIAKGNMDRLFYIGGTCMLCILFLVCTFQKINS